MSHIRLINAIHSLGEQRKALEKMFAIFPGAIFETTSNSFNGRNYSSFEASVPFERFILVAKDFYISQRQSLFNFGRPEIVGPSWSIWDYFISVRLTWREGYNYYYTDGWRRKRGVSGQSIQLKSVEYNQGLNHWKSRYKKLLNLLNKNPNRELVKRYRKQIEEINKEVLEWEVALKEASKINLNGEKKEGT